MVLVLVWLIINQTQHKNEAKKKINKHLKTELDVTSYIISSSSDLHRIQTSKEKFYRISDKIFFGKKEKKERNLILFFTRIVYNREEFVQFCFPENFFRKKIPEINDDNHQSELIVLCRSVKIFPRKFPNIHFIHWFVINLFILFTSFKLINKSFLNE